jgi:hypothetical protein
MLITLKLTLILIFSERETFRVENAMAIYIILCEMQKTGAQNKFAYYSSLHENWLNYSNV